MNSRQERQARNEALMQEVNEQIELESQKRLHEDARHVSVGWPG
jgi:hypothetical protein